MIRTSILLLLLSTAAMANTEIHKCVDADGNLTFQDSPCPTPAAEPEVDPEAEPVSEPTADEPVTAPVSAVEPEDGVSYVPVASNRSAGEVETCKEPHRDSIDAIEAEMLAGYSPEQGEQFKQELRGLTDAMRACE